MQVTNDTRLLKKGMYFVAIKGEKRDGHDFIPQALEKGAAGIIDGLDELQRMAAEKRARMRAKVIGVTGSAGKTTTKELCAAFFGALGKTCATKENYNNHIGLPISILGADDDAEFLVLEMGSNHPGEIASLCEIAKPDVSIVTNVGTAHLEFFLTREGIAREKGEILKAAREFGVISPGVYAKDILYSMAARTPLVEAGELPAALSAAVAEVLPGEFNQTNAALAFAAAARFGLTEDAAIRSLSRFALPGSRSKPIERDGILFIDDTYNANPDAMFAALDLHASREGFLRRVAILGDMFELGGATPQFHKAVFEHAAQIGMDLVIAVGKESSKCRCDLAFSDAAALRQALGDILKRGDVVLLKASHTMELSSVLA